MSIIRALPVVAISAMLAACSNQPNIDTVGGLHAQKVMPDNTITGEACDGHDKAQGVKLSGHSYLYVSADIRDASGGGSAPWMTLNAPAYEGVSKLPLLAYVAAQPGMATCAGGAMRTVVRREEGVLYLDYVLEVAEPPSAQSQKPAAPWVVQGRLPIDEVHGTAAGRIGFFAFGRPFVAYIKATPGPVWVEEENARRLAEDEINHPAPQIARPLPDERPGRTLQDVMRANPR